MQVANPWKSYRQIATQTAPPGQLVLMLFEGALRFLDRSLTGFAIEDPAESNMVVHNNVQRAQDIIRELNGSLNLQQGGEFAEKMRNLYEYFDRRLWESDLKKDRRGIDEVIRHLTKLRDAWASMLAGQSNADESVPAHAAGELVAA